MNQEKVSVIVPIYNVEAYLNRCIDSLIGQVYPNIEIIMVDDCSTDGSAEIAKEYAEQYPEKCRFVQHSENAGAAATRNTGLDCVTGDWIAFVDSDDWVTEDYISSMYEVAVKDEADIVANNSRYLFYSNSKVRYWDFCESVTTNSSHKEKIVKLSFSSNCKLYRRSFVKKTGIKFPEEIWRCEDLAMITPLLTYTEKISVLHRPLYYYFQRTTSSSNQNYKNVDMSFYPKAICKTQQLAHHGFENELEFHAIAELMYGMIMVMLRSGFDNKPILDQIDWFEKRYPNWKSNPYLSCLPKGKRIFIMSAQKKRIILLKLLIWAWDQKQKLHHG